MAVTLYYEKVCRKKESLLGNLCPIEEQGLVWESGTLKIIKVEKAGFNWLSRSKVNCKLCFWKYRVYQWTLETEAFLCFKVLCWLNFLVKTLTSHWDASLPDLKTSTLTALSNQRFLESPCIACLQTCQGKRNITHVEEFFQSLYIGGAKSGEIDWLLSVFFYEGGAGGRGGVRGMGICCNMLLCVMYDIMFYVSHFWGGFG